MSNHILITCLLAGTIIGCPMGLGKDYTNRPAFFHTNFYTLKKDTNDLPDNQKIIQQASAQEQKRSL